jgi:hypothetical protein
MSRSAEAVEKGIRPIISHPIFVFIDPLKITSNQL